MKLWFFSFLSYWFLGIFDSMPFFASPIKEDDLQFSVTSLQGGKGGVCSSWFYLLTFFKIFYPFVKYLSLSCFQITKNTLPFNYFRKLPHLIFMLSPLLLVLPVVVFTLIIMNGNFNWKRYSSSSISSSIFDKTSFRIMNASSLYFIFLLKPCLLPPGSMVFYFLVSFVSINQFF